MTTHTEYGDVGGWVLWVYKLNSAEWTNMSESFLAASVRRVRDGKLPALPSSEGFLAASARRVRDGQLPALPAGYSALCARMSLIERALVVYSEDPLAFDGQATLSALGLDDWEPDEFALEANLCCSNSRLELKTRTQDSNSRLELKTRTQDSNSRLRLASALMGMPCGPRI